MPIIDNYIFSLNENVSREHVNYSNRYGVQISADLYLPKNTTSADQLPALIIGAPYGGVKEQGPGVYANELAQRGFAVLTFDPSFNGYSGGSVRHLSSPDLFVEDFSAAVDFVGTRPFINRDKIGVIGICGSGSFGLSAAQVDRRIKAIATVSMYDIARFHEKGFHDALTESDRNSWLDAIAEQRYAEFEGTAPAMTPRGAPMDIGSETDEIGREFGEFYSRPRGYHHNSITQFTMSSAPSFINFALLDHLEWISPRPILFIIGENAHSRYFSEDAYQAAGEAKELMVIPDANHVDLYDKTNVIPFEKLEQFFTSAFTA